MTLMTVLIVLIILYCAILLASFLTGKTGREYEVLIPNEMVKINKEHLKVEDLAKRYLPYMYLDRQNESPPLLWVWYEAIGNADTIDITYFFNWENEIHPNAFIHKLYSFYRAIYYGFPIFDIEYVQINVGKETGNIEKIRFETSPEADYNIEISTHLTAEYFPSEDGTFSERITQEEEVVSESHGGMVLKRSENHVILRVLTWNHLSGIIISEEDIDDGTTFVADKDLRNLTNSDYRKYKFVRKSHGDYQTEEGKVSLWVSNVVIFLFISIPAFLFTGRNRD